MRIVHTPAAAMTDRYFVEPPIAEAPSEEAEGGLQRVRLAGAEAHHLIHVMRAKPGLQVVLFDGSGAEFPARVERVGRTDVQLAVLSRVEVDRELPLDLTLGVALPKGDRQRWLVEKAVELGVTRIVPLSTVRSVAQPVPQALKRLRRTVVEASKQCGRNRPMEIAPAQQWADFAAAGANTALRVIAHPGGGGGPRLSFAAADLPGQVHLAVGPEGGFADEEVSLAVKTGWQSVDLGPRILRTETAAILLVAMLAGCWISDPKYAIRGPSDLTS